jgi:hypothetical protein
MGAFCSFLFILSNLIPILGPVALSVYFGKEKVTSINLHRFLKNTFFYFMIIGELVCYVVLYIINSAKSITSPGLIIGMFIVSCFFSSLLYLLGQRLFKPKHYTISCT